LDYPSFLRFFFALGGVATAAQEFVVWIPLRLTGLLILPG